jgi:hypothetical protein
MKKPIRRSRMLGWDRNPLRRRSDRLEAGMIAGLIAVFLIAGPVLVAVAMHWTRAAGLQQQRAEATWRQVPATVARSAPTQRNGSLGPADTFWTLARWAAPDGQPRNGWIPVSPHIAAGSSVRVWVNRSGALTGSPLQRAQLHGRIVIFGMLTAAVLGLLLCVVGIAGRLLFSRRRLADWDTAWQAVGPRWTPQR